jgi:hypothetical protein
MARGWESKSVEEQMANALQQSKVGPGSRSGKPKSLAGDSAGNGFESEEARRVADKQRTERERQMQALNLQRENILSQKTSHPARRTALEAALAHIETQIEQMN